MKAFFEPTRDKYREIHYFNAVNNNCPPHFHSQIELYIVTSGRENVTINNQAKILEKGEMSVSLAYDIHSYHTLGDSVATVLIIPNEMVARFNVLVAKKKNITPFITDHETVCTIIDCIQKIKECGGTELKVRGYVYVILASIFENLKFSEIKMEATADLSSKILHYLEENFKENITLSKVSTDLGYSPYYLSSFFNQYFQCGLNDYINMIRLRYFLHILENNDFNITNCAYDSGFPSIRTFNRAFKKEFEITPKEYIAKNFKK